VANSYRFQDNPDYRHHQPAAFCPATKACWMTHGQKGATIISLAAAGVDADPHGRKMAPHLVLDATDDMAIMQEEIFGPLLPVMVISSFDAALQYINAHRAHLLPITLAITQQTAGL
jgi:coniferyl-aldehyde dehydrogenase